MSDVRLDHVVIAVTDWERANAFYEGHCFTRDGSEQRDEVWAGLLEVRYRRALP